MTSTLINKIATASLRVGTLTTDKRNEQQRYDYISADKVLERAGDALAKTGVVVVPSITSENTEAVKTDKGGTRYDSTVHFGFIISDGENQLEMPWCGRGSDYSSPDKALYKAITSGHKYFLMKLLNIGVGNEDGEHEEVPQIAQDAAPQTQQRPRPQPSPASDVEFRRTPEPPDGNPFDDNVPYYARDWQRLTGKHYDLVDWMRQLHRNQSGPCSKDQYGYVTGILDKLTGGQHNYVLSLLCQAEISKTNLPSKDAVSALIKHLAPTVKQKDEAGNEVEAPNPKYRQDFADIVAELAKQPVAEAA